MAHRAALGTVAVSVAVVGLPTLAQAAAPTTPFISEIHYDNDGGDTGEFVEVTFPAGTSASGWSVELYNGSNGARYDSDALTPNADGVAVVTYSGTLQNGSPDGIALIGPTGVVEFLSYEGVLTASGSTAAGRTSTDIGVSQSGGDPIGQTLSRRYNTQTETLQWFGPADGSQSAVNPTYTPTVEEPEPEEGPCDVTPTHEIGAVQGEGTTTPVNGQQVTVRGTVVGDVQDRGIDGFYLQDAGDRDPDTSDGIFVFSPDAAQVALGDEVAVSGRAGEFFGQTQVSAGASDVQVCTPGDVDELPPAADLQLPSDGEDREPLEGMRVAPTDTLTISELFDLTNRGELTLSEGGLLVQPTEQARPGPEAEAIADENVRRQIVLDDGSDNGVNFATRPYLERDLPVRVGDELTFTSPLVLGFGFGSYRLQPADGTPEGTFARQNTRTAAPDEVGGDVQVGAFNVLNYFLTWSGSDARGARDAAQFQRQAAKIVTAISALDADVVTLMEIEDTDSTGYTPGNADTALADLVQRLNTAARADVWTFVPLPRELYGVDRDVIRNGIVYRTDAVQAVGKPAGLVDESVWSNAREPVAQMFKPRGVDGGDRFIVIANHFKSKSPGAPKEDNVDSGDGQGQWNGDRVRQAASLAEFAAELSRKKDEPDVLLMGDFNAYTQEDPIERLREAGYVDLGEQFDPGRYSYVFQKQSGSLDHAMANAALTSKVDGVAHWNINAVESYDYTYFRDPALYSSYPYRSSDHDPLVLGIDLAEPGADD